MRCQGRCADLRLVHQHLLYEVLAWIVIRCSCCIVVRRIPLDTKGLGLCLDEEGTGFFTSCCGIVAL